MRTVTRSKRRQMELDLHTLISGGVSSEYAVTHTREASTSTFPRAYVEVTGPDKVNYQEHEGGVLRYDGRYLGSGECGFSVWVRANIPRADSHNTGLLYEEIDRRAEEVEDAIKYGAAIDDFENDKVNITYTAILPTLTIVTFDDTDSAAAIAWIQGTIKYDQQDK